MNPIFIKSAGHRLFGVEHVASPHNDNLKQVLICSPIGNEYMRSHYLIRQLAAQLQLAGFSVLRFDWFGYGDSDGNTEDASVEMWLQNIEDAAEKLIEGKDVTDLTIIGYRFGATLAFYASSRISSIKSLMLWEPVISGKKWLRKLNVLHRAFLNTATAKAKKLSTFQELLGFSFSRKLQEQISRLNLLEDTLPEINELVINSAIDEDCRVFIDRLKDDGKGKEIKTSIVQKLWDDHIMYDRVTMSSPAVPLIVKSLGDKNYV